MSARGIALITGASRGIGASTAVRLAAEGFDVAITARTVNEGEQRDHSSTVAVTDTRPLPGSLSTTTRAIEAYGVRCLAIASDLMDRQSLQDLATTVEENWGRVDVLVNNGRYIGPGQIDRLIDTPLDVLDRHIEGNVMGSLVLIKALLPGMLSRGSGRIINLTSPAGFANPPAAAGDGGWGMGYAISKGAFGRVAGVLAVELGDQGIVAFNVNPGFVPTERMKLEIERFGFDMSNNDSPNVAAEAITWLATAPDAADLNGKTLDAPRLCHERGLVPWPE
jgi:NAD(P)-dependent dehydrogenase (short-subunit alcohol dehydrogenase family)